MRDREVSRNKNKGTDKQVIAKTHIKLYKEKKKKEKTKHTKGFFFFHCCQYDGGID
jgi:hypothetical protein